GKFKAMNSRGDQSESNYGNEMKSTKYRCDPIAPPREGYTLPRTMDRSEVKIFVSSTFIDLKDIRAKVIKWLGEVLEARLVVMETFGSDAARPDVISVRRVRECDLFVGIYAHRYGSIDPTSGKSTTELEL